ncbi:MAG TPA: amino acid adenylation domain-containing protein, partial [Thermoanaerobaculia bacterium]|nr:amino acid adenylation domain-containing protein [Thermoanaerobaculia bacterium]
RTTAKFDLTLGLREWNSQLIGAVEYVTELFDAATVDRLAGHFERLLAAAVAAPDTAVYELALLSPAEREQILVEWNETGPVSEPRACLHELFAAQARRTPEAVALVVGERELRYRELREAADRLAAHLRDAGVGPETVVGLCLERSTEMVVAVLAILAAGGAYLPLDPRQPRQRLAGMLAASGAVALVSDERLAAELAWSGSLILVDRDSEESRDGSDPVRTADPENLAYVLYTSGSTGAPKGVAVTHRSAVELVRWAGGVFGPEELSGVLAATSLGFDLSVFELFVPLCYGGTVILAQDVLELPALPARERVSLVNTVPSALSELLHAGSLGESIRTVNLAGEALPRSLADRLYATGTVERVWNLYGPSEDTTYSTFSLVCRDGSGAPGIGRPITATRAYILAPGLAPVPVGAAGELCLGGAGLTRGYLCRPDLTAERFVPDPFDGSGGRLYRTGDFVRWLPDGTLEFLGRLDHQVKVRGFRIELGEIEAALATLAGVREAVVVAREDAPGDRRLVAYVTGDAAKLAADELRQSLRERLPDYMVPTAFVILPAFPLTSNGKVDRRALARLEPERQAASWVPPRDLTELRIARLFEELLAAGPVGAGDDFFELGGHSLLAVRLLARLRRELGRDLPLSALFRGSTVERLAAAVRSGEVEGSPLVALRTGGALPPLFLVHPVGGNVLCYAELARRLDPGRPVSGLQSMAAGNGHAPTLESMAISYLSEIRKVQPHGPYSLGGWSMGGAVAFEMARQLSLAGETVAPLVLIDAFAPRAGGDSQPLAAADLLALFGRDLAGLTGRSLGLPDTLPDESAESHLRRVHERGLAAGLFPPDLGADDVVRLFAVFRANLKAMSGYRGGSYGGPLLLLRAGEGVSGAAADLGWGRLATGPLEIVDLPGDHYSILRSPAVDELSSRITAVLGAQS